MHDQMPLQIINILVTRLIMFVHKLFDQYNLTYYLILDRYLSFEFNMFDGFLIKDFGDKMLCKLTLGLMLCKRTLVVILLYFHYQYKLSVRNFVLGYM